MIKDKITDVFFDLDHTLWDFEKNSALTFQKVFKEYKISISLEEFLKVYIPLNQAYWKLYREEKLTKEELRYKRLKGSFDAVKQPISDDLIHILSEAYILQLTNFNHIFPNTIEILEYLSSKYMLHIITNGFEEVQEKKLRSSNLHHYFTHVINSEMAGVKKPHPHIFELALSKANVLPKNSMMIGDTFEADILGAHAVGLHTIHFNSNNEPHHQFCPIINDLTEIKNVL